MEMGVLTDPPKIQVYIFCLLFQTYKSTWPFKIDHESNHTKLMANFCEDRRQNGVKDKVQMNLVFFQTKASF